MTQTYRDMHKINELAQALIDELEKYKRDIQGTMQYDSFLDYHDGVRCFIDDEHYRDDPDAALANAQDALERWEHDNPEANKPHELEPELQRVSEHIKCLKTLTIAESS